MHKTKLVFVLLVLIGVTVAAQATAGATEPALQTLTYTENFDNFPNPERGFHRWTQLRTETGVLQPLAVSSLRAQGISLILGLVIVGDYIASDFDSTLITQISDALALARDSGLKVNFRLYYNDQSYSDPDLARMLSHIGQLQQLFAENTDVINVVEAGFIGPWGEWHSSNLGNPPAVSAMTDVLNALLAAVPPERMVSIRRPMFKRQIFANPGAPDGYEVLTPETAFDGSNLARTGYHNDAFVSSDTDLGTYVDPGWTRADELTYAGNEARFTPFGGESSWHSPLHNYTHCTYSVSELETLHASYLNDGWYGDVLSRWESEGCMDEIKRRLGYRFVLQDAQISEEVKPGGVLQVIMNLENVGFAAPFNPRNVDLVLESGSDSYTASISVDPRRWEPGGTITVARGFRIPADMPEGSYDVKLHLPDPAPTLQDDSRYAIRLANDGVWDETTGYNVLMQGLQVHSQAPGHTTGDTDFHEVYHAVVDGPAITSESTPLSSNPLSPTVLTSDVTVAWELKSYVNTDCTGVALTHSWQYRPAGTQDAWTTFTCATYLRWAWCNPAAIMGNGSFECRIKIEDCLGNQTLSSTYYLDITIDPPPVITDGPVVIGSWVNLSTDSTHPTSIDPAAGLVWSVDDIQIGCTAGYTHAWQYRPSGTQEWITRSDFNQYMYWVWLENIGGLTGSGSFDFQVSVTDCMDQTTVSPVHYITVQ